MRRWAALRLGLAAWLGLFCAGAHAQPIDRHALVSRHNITLEKIDPHAPLMLGNGNLGFTADITGLQTFPEQYSRLAPLLTMAQWAWHSFPNPQGWSEQDGLVMVPVPGRGEQPYPWIRDWAELDRKPALKWLRENPHRFNLGRIGLALLHKDGTQAKFSEIVAPRQDLDLWTGTLTSRFSFDGAPVEVRTAVAGSRDALVVSVVSPLVAEGRIGVDLRHPGVSSKLNPDPSDWSDTGAHRSNVVEGGRGLITVRRRIDDTVYFSQIVSPRGTITALGPHAFRVLSPGGTELRATFAFDRSAPHGPTDRGFDDAARHWRNFWQSGGAIDFSGSTDPRAPELERRVVLSQYLAAINEAGEYPPQEEGLFSNSWNGKFHLEVHGLHAGQWAQWNRPELLERSLQWYLDTLPYAREVAARHRVEGAWWTKMAGPNGWNSPSTINPFIMWQQPNPIWMAELVYRARPQAATLERYGTLVEETAKLLTSWPRREGERYVLGPPIVPVQENHPPLTTVNPAFELEFFRLGLAIAQQWRERRGLARNGQWDSVIAGLAAPATRDGLYLPVETEPDFWRNTQSAACSGHAENPPCLNRDHPLMLMAYGLIPGRIDRETMRRTLGAVTEHWDLRQTWGWDFPVIAMTAARLGQRETAVDWLFRDLPNNRWGVSGMTPRVHLEAEKQLIGPAGAAAGAGPDGPGYARAAETYFPSNGSLLLAVGMMAAGWDGSAGPAPGFPEQGWKVRAEGIQPLP